METGSFTFTWQQTADQGATFGHYKVRKNGKLEKYHKVMLDQINTGIIEPIPDQLGGKQVHYIPYHAVFKENAYTAKLRIVYDCSSKESNDVSSLNDCLEPGLPLQPRLFDILVRNRFKKFLIISDVQKAFVQIRIDDRDLNVQRILWSNNVEDRLIKEFCCSRVIFGASPSPYILGATIERHLEQYKEEYTDTINTLKKDTYVDDIQVGGDSIESLRRFKVEPMQIMAEAGFTCTSGIPMSERWN